MTAQPDTGRRRWPSLALFLLLTVGGGLLIGLLTAPGEWYAGLTKPAFNPPNWIFGPVWTVLYVLIGIAGWRVWRAEDVTLQRLWWAQMALNFLWSPVFFGAGNLGAALVVILALLAAILAFIFAARHRERISAWLFLPYALWVGFATLLNAELLRLNG